MMMMVVDGGGGLLLEQSETVQLCLVPIEVHTLWHVCRMSGLCGRVQSFGPWHHVPLPTNGCADKTRRDKAPPWKRRKEAMQWHCGGETTTGR